MFDIDAWAAKGGMTPTVAGAGDLLAFSDMETVIFLAERVGMFTVEKVSRSGPRQILGSFSSRDDAMAFFVYWLGQGLAGTSPPADFGYDGATLETGPTAVHLSWAGGSAQFSLGVTGPVDAAKFNWARTRTLDEIARGLDHSWK